MSWTPEPEIIDKLTLGLGWRMPLASYKTRNNFYCGFEIKGDSDLFPILEGKIELEVPSLTAPEFTLEMAVTPSKISTEHREAVVQLLKNFAEDDDRRRRSEDGIGHAQATGQRWPHVFHARHRQPG